MERNKLIEILKENPPELEMNRNNPADTWYSYDKMADAIEKLIEEERAGAYIKGSKDCLDSKLMKLLQQDADTKELRIKDLEELGRRLPSVAYAEGYDIEKIIDSKIKEIREEV